ncbi:MAG: polyphosphate:AMP phosphotransferase [Candidatus Latescibacteria bacterium]|nr:polyphosphate:AMP phosphotransferase [Candidatus Latescibacterota bacterium]
MFETAELGRKVSRQEYKAQVPQLRTELLELQQQLRSAGFAVIVIFAGVDGAGKSETIDVLNEWMDPRGLLTRAFDPPTSEEQERPHFWRYWLALPPKGRIGLYLSSWYSQPLVDRVYGQIDQAIFDQSLNRITTFEKELAADGTLILKFWMHLGKKAQKRRLDALEKDPLTRWRVTKREKRHWKMYDLFESVADRLLHKTNTGEAPWYIVEGADHNYRTLSVATLLRDAIRRHLERRAVAGGEKLPVKPVARVETRQPHTVLSRLDMSQKVARAEYDLLLEKYQGKLHLLTREAKARQVSTILVFEGVDAAGKGGAIHRLTGAMDARLYQVIPIAAPTDEERAQHYLWRFWRHLPRAGRVTIFDRSWYGRVLVERVEGFADDAAWRRAYAEINDFEEQLAEHGVVLVKYWAHITQEEQLRRFESRQETPYKSYKLTAEDWRNREKWELYEQAVNDMVAYTSTNFAPWTLVEGNDKYFARLKVLRVLCERLGAALNR